MNKVKLDGLGSGYRCYFNNVLFNFREFHNNNIIQLLAVPVMNKLCEGFTAPSQSKYEE